MRGKIVMFTRSEYICWVAGIVCDILRCDKLGLKVEIHATND